MNQIKIGGFIADLRKERGWTQSKLAENIGVSDKTVSKWECGKGLPEISVLMPLCDVLEINVNELLSGERLSQNDYSQKAEVNIMELIKETEETKKKSKNSKLVLLLAMTAIIFVMCFSMLVSGVSIMYFLDLPSLFVLLTATLLFMLAAGMWKGFWTGVKIALGINKNYVKEDVLTGLTAVSFTKKTLLYVGVFESLLQICMVFMLLKADVNLYILIKNLAVALLTGVYGITGYLLLLPVKGRLEVLSK